MNTNEETVRRAIDDGMDKVQAAILVEALLALILTVSSKGNTLKLSSVIIMK